MTAAPRPAYVDEEISVFALAGAIVRWRWWIVGLAVVGGAIGAARGLTTTRVYKSGATFIPQGTESGLSGLAAAAGQLGLRMPTANAAWGPSMYVQVLRSRSFLERLALDTLTIAEDGGRRAAVIDFLRSKGPTPAHRIDAAVTSLQRMVIAEEVKSLGAVRTSVVTTWPSVSHQLAQSLLSGINEFNFDTRKSQAAAERQFAEVQAAEALVNLRAAEDKLQAFLERNRVVISPDLTLERERHQREVLLRQQLYGSLLQNREEARFREVRDTPAITVIESPRLPLMGEPRNTVTKGLVGILGGAMLGLVLTLVFYGVERARHTTDDDAREFFAAVDAATPRFLRKRRGG